MTIQQYNYHQRNGTFQNDCNQKMYHKQLLAVVSFNAVLRYVKSYWAECWNWSMKFVSHGNIVDVIGAEKLSIQIDSIMYLSFDCDIGLVAYIQLWWNWAMQWRHIFSQQWRSQKEQVQLFRAGCSTRHHEHTQWK